MALLDVNALVALAWDSHVHHAAMRAWFKANGAAGWLAPAALRIAGNSASIRHR